MPPISPPLDPSEAPEAHPPLRMSAYSVVRVVRGATARVYLSYTNHFGTPDEPVAIKRLDRSLTKVRDLPKLFLRECYHWLMLGSHQNLTQALHVHYAPPDNLMLVMEYMPESLRELMQGEPLPAHDAMRYVLNVLDGLIYAGSVIEDFVHGDLKPENILLSADHVAKITDLGLSRSINEAVFEMVARRLPLRVDADLPLEGSALYISPEQIRGESPTKLSDVYSVGCIAYELIAGTPVYGRPVDSDQYRLQHLTSSPLPLPANTQVPADLADLVLSCLAKDPTARPQVKEARDELASIMRSFNLPVAVPEGSEPDFTVALSAVQGLVHLGFFDQALPEARKLYARSLEFNPTTAVMAGTFIVACLNETARYEQAAEAIADIERINFQEVDKIAKMAHMQEKSLMQLGKAHELRMAALKTMEEAAVLAPEASVSWANLGAVRYQVGDPEGAIEALEKALVISRSIAYFVRLVPILTQQNRHREAVNYGVMATQIHPEDGSAHAIACTAMLEAALDGMTPVEELITRALREVDIAREYGIPNELGAEIGELLLKVRGRAEIRQS